MYFIPLVSLGVIPCPQTMKIDVGRVFGLLWMLLRAAANPMKQFPFRRKIRQCLSGLASRTRVNVRDQAATTDSPAFWSISFSCTQSDLVTGRLVHEKYQDWVPIPTSTICVKLIMFSTQEDQSVFWLHSQKYCILFARLEHVDFEAC